MAANLWNQPGIPHKGWHCVGIEDLEEASATCEMCGKERIRYVHGMEHPDGLSLNVGCICAGKMTGDYEGAKRRERDARNRASRRTRWLSRQWKVSAKGNHYLKLDGRHLLVFKNRSGQYGIKVGKEFDCRAFPTPAAAKLALFDAFDVD